MAKKNIRRDPTELDEEDEDEALFRRAQRKPAVRDLAEWDAEIEAGFQREVAATKRAGRLKQGRKHVGFSWAFLVDVCRLTKGRTTLVVAIYIYRRTHVCRSKTITLPASE